MPANPQVTDEMVEKAARAVDADHLFVRDVYYDHQEVVKKRDRLLVLCSTALTAALADHVVVPREPTEAMSLAGRKACAAVADKMETAKQTAISISDFLQQVGHKPADSIYRAMISAAPLPQKEG